LDKLFLSQSLYDSVYQSTLNVHEMYHYNRNTLYWDADITIFVLSAVGHLGFVMMSLIWVIGFHDVNIVIGLWLIGLVVFIEGSQTNKQTDVVIALFPLHGAGT